MAAEENKGKGTTGGGTGTGGQAAGKATSTGQGGQQISGEQIFTTTEENTGGESFATTGAGDASTTGGVGAGGGESQANLSDAVSGVVSGDTSKAKDMLNQAKNATGEVASQALGQVQEKASTFVDTKTSDFAQGLTSIAGSLRQFTENLRNNSGEVQQTPVAQTVAQYGETVTNQVERVADYLDRADLQKLTRDVESFARRNPAIFIGSAFALGILASRFIKSSQRRPLPANRQITAGTGRRGIGTTGGTADINLGTTGTTTGSTATATGEPPALGKTLPSLDSPTTDTGASDTGTTPRL